MSLTRQESVATRRGIECMEPSWRDYESEVRIEPGTFHKLRQSERDVPSRVLESHEGVQSNRKTFGEFYYVSWLLQAKSVHPT